MLYKTVWFRNRNDIHGFQGTHHGDLLYSRKHDLMLQQKSDFRIVIGSKSIVLSKIRAYNVGIM